jgi:hypothetical protein
MGAERSGTSALARFLCEELGYEGEPEGHVFNLLYRLQSSVRSHFISNGFRADLAPTAPDGVKVDFTTAELISHKTLDAALCTLWREVVGSRHSGLWFDKTPGPDFIRCAPTLLQMYPQARFIFLIRDPVSSVESSMRKFSSDFSEACERWKECAEAWLQSKGALSEGSFIELKTHELTSKPEECLERIAKLLANHPLSMSADDVQGRPLVAVERTSMGDLGKTKPLHATGWTSEQRKIFHEKCASLASVFGFLGDEEMDAPRAAGIHFPPPHGQKNVEVIHGAQGGVWPQLHEGEICIFLHPSLGEPETSITYRDIDLPTAGEVVATAFVLPEAGSSIEFEMKVQASSDFNVIGNSSCVCAAGEKKQISLKLSHPVKEASLRIKTCPTSDSVVNAWALISCPRFIPRESDPSTTGSSSA